VEAGNNDEDHVLPVQSRSSRRISTAPWLCMVCLVLAGVSGRSLWSRRGASSVHRVDPVALALDLSDSKITVHMDVLGIDHANLAPDQKVAFTKAIKDAVSTKCKIDDSAVEVDDTLIESTEVDGTNPARTEFKLEITVPAELTTDALKERLVEDGDWKKLIRDELVDSAITRQSTVIVHSGVINTKTEQVLVSEADAHDPIIVLDMDIKGVYYSKLAGKDVRAKFATAIQSGIATERMEATSIGLDVSDGGSNTGSPFVHVTAKIPVPAGVSADATMSRWPDGAAQIGEQVQKNLRAISDVEQMTRDGDAGPHPVLVFPGTLHLGAVRQTYATHLKVGMGVQHLRYNGGAARVEPQVIEDTLKAALVKVAGVEEDDVQVEGTPTQTANEIKYTFSVSARGAAAAAKKMSDWEQQLLPAGRQVQTFFKTTNPEAITDDDEYMVSVGIGDVSNEVDTIDLDLVVHGVNYNEISDKRKKSFLTRLAEAVRQGINDGSGGNDDVDDSVDKIRVVVSPHGTDDTLNVRAQIPAPETSRAQLNMMRDLDAQLVKDKRGGIQEQVEARIEAIQGIEFLTTWTAKAIYVSVPGRIDDFAGDISIRADRT